MTTDKPADDAPTGVPAHIRATDEGFTHWSSGPGSLTFDPACHRCWYDRGHEDAHSAEKGALLREAAKGIARLYRGTGDEVDLVDLYGRIVALVGTDAGTDTDETGGDS